MNGELDILLSDDDDDEVEAVVADDHVAFDFEPLTVSEKVYMAASCVLMMGSMGAGLLVASLG